MITKTNVYLFNQLPESFKKNIVIDDNGCWIWLVNINRNGYGRCYIKGKRHMIHKYLYKMFKHDKYYKKHEKILVLDHLCTNRQCCNPAHLQPVTQQVNVHRGKALLYRKG